MMMQSHAKMVALIATAALTGLATASPAAAGVAEVAPLVDHHMHIFSPAAAQVLTAICKKVGPEKCPEEISRDPSGGGDVVRALDAAGIRRGVLLSAGYLFSSPDASGQNLNVAEETRAENTYDVEQANAECGRLVAFISVNPLAPNALSEIAFWGQHGGATGLKLHLSNSGFDFRSPQQVRKLAATFRAAARYHLPIVVHLQTRRADYGRQDAEIFLKNVLPAAHGDIVQIAHAAGGGGVDKSSLSALGAFADAIKRDPKATSGLYFDLAQVPDLVANTAQLKSSAANDAALVALMRQIGLHRFLLGSDWTSGLNLKPYYAEERRSLDLPDADWQILATNVAPYMPPESKIKARCRSAG